MITVLFSKNTDTSKTLYCTSKTTKDHCQAKLAMHSQ